MRLLRIAILASLLAPLALGLGLGCGGDDGGDHDPFDTFQACFDDHHKVETFGTVDAIKICCIDHPIGTAAANVVCGNSLMGCEAYVTANLAGADATSTDIMGACDGYITDRNK